MLNYGERQEQEKASAKDLGIVKLLLENCIKLLKDDRNSDVSEACHIKPYILSDENFVKFIKFKNQSNISLINF